MIKNNMDQHQHDQDALDKMSPPTLSVTDLTQQVKLHIEKCFETLWVVGEVSNLTYHRSGHVYFTLKDAGAQLPAVLWKMSASKIKFTLKEGMEILCQGCLNVYPLQGKYQMIVSEVRPRGVGSLELAFQQLRDKLAAEGLFLSARKKPLPSTIRQVALLTSPTGAAIRDFLQILTRRTKLIDVLIVPIKVQGEGAAEEAAKTLKTMNRLGSMDCIVIARGGGSLEDLWAFNEEVLVRAVAASNIPIVSGVGHETDVTLCDFAADIRVATPSEAAERISREDSQRRQEAILLSRRLDNFIEQRLRQASEKIDHIGQNTIFRKPNQITENRQYLLDSHEKKLERLVDHRFQMIAEQICKAGTSLEALSPLSVLLRGYSLTETPDGKPICGAGEIQIGELFRTRFADGVIACRREPDSSFLS